MDLDQIMGTLMNSDTLAQVSQKTGASPQAVQSVLASSLPQLLSGAQAQADSAATAEGFVSALAQHGQEDTSDLAAFVQKIDLDDGQKIVGHLLGDQAAGATEAAAERAGLSLGNTSQIMSAAAPLLMSLLGQQTGASQGSASASGISSLMGSLLGNVDVGSLLTGLLGGGAATAATTTTTTSTGKKKKKKEEKKEDAGLLGSLGDLLGGLLK